MKDTLTMDVKVNGPWWVSGVYWSQVAWRVALTVLLCVLAWRVWGLHAAYMQTQQWARELAMTEAEATRGDAIRAITDTRNDLLAEVKGWRKDTGKQLDDLRGALLGPKDSLKTDVLARVDKGLGDADARLKDATDKLDAQLTRTNDTLAAARPALDHMGSVAKQVDNTAPMFLDCEYNPDCVFNRFQGTSKAIEKTAQAVATAAPGIAAAADSTSQSVAGIAAAAKREADEFTKPKTTRQKIADWLGLIPRIFKIIL